MSHGKLSVKFSEMKKTPKINTILLGIITDAVTSVKIFLVPHACLEILIVLSVLCQTILGNVCFSSSVGNSI